LGEGLLSNAISPVPTEFLSEGVTSDSTPLIDVRKQFTGPKEIPPSGQLFIG